MGLLIHSLTKDEDLRQDLWVVYLSQSACEHSLFRTLPMLQMSKEIQTRCVYFLDRFDSFKEVQLLPLSEIQKKILFLSMLEFTAIQIAQYNQLDIAVIYHELDVLSKWFTNQDVTVS